MNAPPPLPAGLRQVDPRAPQKEEPAVEMPVSSILYIVITAIFYLIYGIGAYRIAYNTSSSVFMGILAFLFAPLYYPYYGLFVSQPVQAPVLFGGRRRKH